MTEKINWEYLIERFAKNTCSKEEFDQLMKLVENNEFREGFTEELLKHWENAGDENKNAPIDWEEKFSSLLNNARSKAPVISLYSTQKKMRLVKWAAAASVLLIILVGSYFGFYSRNSPTAEISKTPATRVELRKGDIAPGGNKAILTLADGSVIDLDSAQNGTLTTQGNIKIIKGEDGQLLYYVDQESSPVMGYNTISTPRGGKYEIVLSDGTKVWLNAASSLKFPASFTGKTRDVTLTGEGYFEVAHLTSEEQRKVPFIVSVASSIGDGKGITVEVLGTHFNVNAYSDGNSVATTLLEGSVKVIKGISANSGSRSVLLKPGEQADLTKADNFKVNHYANIEEVIAWKNDNFEFNNASVTDIMRQISRWYDVDVEYRGLIPEHKLTGKISRNVNLSKLIDMIQYTGVNMKIENKKIIVWEN
ncbi:MAG TPA: FecR family protein [Hanamia sp.]|nr:FecR family protein [Hanamia sp.]